MNIDKYYMELKNKLSNRPILLDNTNDFLFVLVNTVKAMIENTDKSQLSELDKILDGVTSQELKLAYDFCQGKFGKEGFSYRRHPNYFYLSSLIATFPEFELSKADLDYLKGIINFDNYLLYELDWSLIASKSYLFKRRKNDKMVRNTCFDHLSSDFTLTG